MADRDQFENSSGLPDGRRVGGASASVVWCNGDRDFVELADDLVECYSGVFVQNDSDLALVARCPTSLRSGHLLFTTRRYQMIIPEPPHSLQTTMVLLSFRMHLPLPLHFGQNSLFTICISFAPLLFHFWSEDGSLMILPGGSL